MIKLVIGKIYPSQFLLGIKNSLQKKIPYI